jgi:hypothetical protein
MIDLLLQVGYILLRVDNDFAFCLHNPDLARRPGGRAFAAVIRNSTPGGLHRWKKMKCYTPVFTTGCTSI